jgi:hypothetical protein
MKTRKMRKVGEIIEGLFNSESAASTVIAAVLLLSIIFAIFAVVRIVYVPEWKNDAEQLHMSEVQRDMTELKSTADMIILLQSSNSSSDKFHFFIPSVNVPISMGGGELPVLDTLKSSGTLLVNKEPCSVTISTEEGNKMSINSGTITYSSNNRQYVDQVFRYENGAVILAQGKRSLVTQFPSLFRIKKTGEHEYDVWIQAINISGDSDTVSSESDTSLRLTGSYQNITYLGNTSSFDYNITTKYPDAWESYLKGNQNEIANEKSLEYGTDFILESNNLDNVSLKFFAKSQNHYNIYVCESVFKAEIGAKNSFY